MADGRTETVCTWTEDENGWHDTTCGERFGFEEDGPTENGFKFCPYCGMTMKDQPYVWEDDEEEERERTRAVNGAIAQELDNERIG